jgi:hypothetical protein
VIFVAVVVLLVPLLLLPPVEVLTAVASEVPDCCVLPPRPSGVEEVTPATWQGGGETGSTAQQAGRLAGSQVGAQAWAGSKTSSSSPPLGQRC